MLYCGGKSLILLFKIELSHFQTLRGKNEELKKRPFYYIELIKSDEFCSFIMVLNSVGYIVIYSKSICCYTIYLIYLHVKKLILLFS